MNTKLTNRVNTLGGHVLILKGKLSVAKTVRSLLEKKADDLKAYSQPKCLIVLGDKVTENESTKSLKELVMKKLIELAFPKDIIQINTNKIHRTDLYNKKTKTQLKRVTFNNHSFKVTIYMQRKILDRHIKVASSLAKRRSELLNKLQLQLQLEMGDYVNNTNSDNNRGNEKN